MIKEIAMSVLEAQKELSKQSEASKAFDPDKRLKIERPGDGVKINEDPSKKALDIGREYRDTKHSAEKYSPDKRLEVKLDRKKIYTTSVERIKMAAQSSGEWLGKVGNSEFRPFSELAKKALESFNQTGIKYKDGNPDFSKCSIESLKIKNMTSDRLLAHRRADKALAEKWSAENKFGKNDWSRTDIRNWRHDNRYTWHERIDKKTMDLVQSDIHAACKHFGGIAECKRMERAGGAANA